MCSYFNELGYVGVVEVHHVDQDGVRTQETDGVAIGHWYMGLGLEKYPISFCFGTVHCYCDTIFCRHGCHLFIDAIRDTASHEYSAHGVDRLAYPPGVFAPNHTRILSFATFSHFSHI